MSQIKRQVEGSFFKEHRTFVRRDAKGFPIGPRTKSRQAGNRDLNKLGIRECEIKLPGCFRNKMLTWAHSTKSRFILTKKDWRTAARACLNCHNKLDFEMSHAEMKRIVLAAISLRKENLDDFDMISQSPD